MTGKQDREYVGPSTIKDIHRHQIVRKWSYEEDGLMHT